MKVEEETPEIQMKVEEPEPVILKMEEGSGVFRTSGSYSELPDKPKINGTVLQGNVSLAEIGIRAIALADIEKMFVGW